MRTPARRRSAARRACTAAAIVPVLLLAACSGDDGGDTASPSTSASSPAEETPGPDLASGLLPADAFGPDAAVVAVTVEQLRQGAVLAAAGAEGLQITPKDCSAAVAGAQPQFDDFDDVAAQAATVGTVSTVEVLLRGGPVEDAFDQLAGAAGRCPSAQITSPQFGQASITFENLPVADLGDGSAVLRYVTALSLPDGTQATIPSLIGAVQDGDRLLMMINLDAGAASGAAGAPPAQPQDPAAFAALLEQAHEVQAEALN